MIRYFWIMIFILSIGLALLSPPLMFSRMDFASVGLRALLASVTLFLLFFSSSKLTILDACILLIVVSFLLIEIVWQKSQLNNIASYYVVVFFYVLLFRAVRHNELSYEIFLNLWIRLGYFVAITAIFVFILHQFTSLNSDFLKFASLGDFANKLGVLNKQVSIFGVTQDKNFGFMSLARVYSYFDEPQYAGMYFAINAIIAKELSNRFFYRYFLLLSILAGLLTFSVTFYMALLLMFVFYIESKEIRDLAILSIITLCAVFVFYLAIRNIDWMSFLDYTSFGDRLNRWNNGVDILNNASLSNLFWGHGVGYTNNFDRGISSGIMHVLVERGLTGLCFVLMMLIAFSNKNRLFILVCVLFLAVIPWYKYYIYWIEIIIFFLISTRAVRGSAVVKVKSIE